MYYNNMLFSVKDGNISLGVSFIEIAVKVIFYYLHEMVRTRVKRGLNEIY